MASVSRGPAATTTTKASRSKSARQKIIIPNRKNFPASFSVLPAAGDPGVIQFRHPEKPDTGACGPLVTARWDAAM